MDLALRALSAQTSSPAVAGAVFATGTFFKIHKPLLQKIKRLFSLKTSSLRTKCKKEYILSFFRQSKDSNFSAIRITYKYPILPPVPDYYEVSNVIEFCGVKDYKHFPYALPHWEQSSAIKISEGCYNEVYLFRSADGSPRIFKWMPVGGMHPTNLLGNPMSVQSVLPDIVCSTYLSKLNEGPVYMAPNFPKTFKISFVMDKLPDRMVRSWLEYRNRPDKITYFPSKARPDLYLPNQLFLAVELSYCGNRLQLTLESLKYAWSGVSIMTQLVAALAVAEEAFRFEHRDLSLRNIVIKQTDTETLMYSIRDQHFAVNTMGNHVYITDFNMSRISVNQRVYTVDLDMYEIYEPDQHQKWMHGEDMFDEMEQCLNGDWEAYSPRTNIIWLKYVSENILSSIQKNCTRLEVSLSDNFQRFGIQLLRNWNDCVLNHDSAKMFLDDVVLVENPLISMHK